MRRPAQRKMPLKRRAGRARVGWINPPYSIIVIIYKNFTTVYESESYWDKEKRQPRSKRRLIGKIDAETGEIVPTGGRKAGLTDMRETGHTVLELEALCRKQAGELLKGDAEISALKRQVMELTLSLNEHKRRLSKIGECSKL